MTQITIDCNDLKGMVALMDRANEFPTMLLGHNEDGETTITSICEDMIILETNQSNGWVRKNYLHRDGTVEEMFDGKWR